MGFVYLILSVLLFLAPGAYAGTALLLVDRSGSMKTYFEDGVIQKLASEVQNVLQENGEMDLAVFSTEVARVQGVTSPQFTYERGRSFTLLDRALEYALRNSYNTAWMITDNIQDEPGSSQVGNTESFYQILRQDKVHSVLVFPVSQSPGRQGLVIYALLFDSQETDSFSTEIKRVSEKLRATYKTEPLRLKPLDEGTVETVVGESNSQAKPYREGQEVRESLTVRLRSKFDHLKITEANITVPQAQPGFGKESLLVPEKLTIEVTPTLVTLEPGEETQNLYTVSVDLGKIHLKRGLSFFWQAAWKARGEDIPIELLFLLEVPRGNFAFRESFLRDYGARSPEIAKATGKIHGIESLPHLLQGRVTSIRINHRFLLRILYPWWPSVVFTLLLLLLAGVLGAGVWALVRFGQGPWGVSGWTVIVRTTLGNPLACNIGRGGEVKFQDHFLGTISGNWFQASPGVRIEGHQGAIPLKHGLQIRCLQRGESFVLAFSSQTGESTPEERVPRKRVPRKR